MPRVEIVQKHNTAARRLYIRGHNGKIYPYLVMNDACLTESRREERVLQLLRLLNPCLEKRKETTKRHLFFTGGTMSARLLQGGQNPNRKLLHHISKDAFCPPVIAAHKKPSVVGRSFLCLLCPTRWKHTIAICFQVQFPLLSVPCGLPQSRCLLALHLCIDCFV